MKETNRTKYASYDESNWEKAFFDENTNGFIVIHKLHGRGERAGNLAIAMQLVTLGYAVELLPATNEKSFDAHLGDEDWEFKTTSGTSTSVQKRLRVGREQCENILLVVPQRFNLREVLKGIISAVNVDKRKLIKVVGLLFSDKLEIGIIRLSREEIRLRDFKKLSIFFEAHDFYNDDY